MTQPSSDKKPGAYVEVEAGSRSKIFRGPAETLMKQRIEAKNLDELRGKMDQIREKMSRESAGHEVFIHFGAIHVLDETTGTYKKIDPIRAGVRKLALGASRVLNGLTEGNWPSR